MDARKSQTQKMAQETATGLANSLQSGLSYGYLLTMTRHVTIHPLPCVGCTPGAVAAGVSGLVAPA
jgi:hypothetical protein